jgi:hypothetical protein
MNPNRSRRQFLVHGIAVSTTALLLPRAATAQEAKPTATRPIPKRKPPISLEMVRDYVIAGHGKFDKVKELLAKEPGLINATYDWGGGDFETALGGAAHTGHREIALYLLKHKARMDLFCAAMLGQLEIIKTVLAIWPEVLAVPGPHGIPLVEHARQGGKEAKPVYDFLKAQLEREKKG